MTRERAQPLTLLAALVLFAASPVLGQGVILGIGAGAYLPGGNLTVFDPPGLYQIHDSKAAPALALLAGVRLNRRLAIEVTGLATSSDHRYYVREFTPQNLYTSGHARFGSLRIRVSPLLGHHIEPTLALGWGISRIYFASIPPTRGTTTWKGDGPAFGLGLSYWAGRHVAYRLNADMLAHHLHKNSSLPLQYPRNYDLSLTGGIEVAFGH